MRIQKLFQTEVHVGSFMHSVSEWFYFVEEILRRGDDFCSVDFCLLVFNIGNLYWNAQWCLLFDGFVSFYCSCLLALHFELGTLNIPKFSVELWKVGYVRLRLTHHEPLIECLETSSNRPFAGSSRLATSSEFHGFIGEGQVVFLIPTTARKSSDSLGFATWNDASSQGSRSSTKETNIRHDQVPLEFHSCRSLSLAALVSEPVLLMAEYNRNHSL